jgi:hypothetical protein
LYEWAQRLGHVRASPVLVHGVRFLDGGVIEVADQAPRDVRASNVKWLTPRTYRLWRDVGLLGYGADQVPQEVPAPTDPGANLSAHRAPVIRSVLLPRIA